MKELKENEILTRMYRERGDAFENCAASLLLEKEKDVNDKIENELKKRYSGDDEKLITVLDYITELCSINCEVYYKMGVVDGVKLNQEIKEISNKMNL